MDYEHFNVDLEDPSAPQLQNPEIFGTFDNPLLEAQAASEYQDISSQIRNILSSNPQAELSAADLTGYGISNAENPEANMMGQNQSMIKAENPDSHNYNRGPMESKEDAEKRFLDNFFGSRESQQYNNNQHHHRDFPRHHRTSSFTSEAAPLLTQQEIDYEHYYTRVTRLPGFFPFDTKWVPMPFPHKEIAYAKGMYERGENLMVQTPDFVDFANELGN